jgi:hypothetical protein
MIPRWQLISVALAIATTEDAHVGYLGSLVSPKALGEANGGRIYLGIIQRAHWLLRR